MTQEASTASAEGKKGSTIEHVKIKEKKDRTLPPSKVVVRRLPPTMTQETFIEQVSPLPENDYMYFVKGDMSLGQYAFSRAYLNFIHQEDIFIFKDKFDGYVFVDQKGNEYPAVVEFAPFQKIPKRRAKKRDAKCGTLETDPEYVKFLETFQETQDVTLPSTQDCLEEIEAKERELKANNGVLKVTTPLIEFIKQRKAERQRIKEEKREERKRRELERKKSKEEERKKRKEAKEKEIKDRERRERERREMRKDLKDKDSKEKGDKQPVMKLLKNPEREKEREKDAPEDADEAGNEDAPPKEVKSKPRGFKELPSRERDKMRYEKDKYVKREEERQRRREESQKLRDKFKERERKDRYSHEERLKDRSEGGRDYRDTRAKAGERMADSGKAEKVEKDMDKPTHKGDDDQKPSDGSQCEFKDETDEALGKVSDSRKTDSEDEDVSEKSETENKKDELGKIIEENQDASVRNDGEFSEDEAGCGRKDKDGDDAQTADEKDDSSQGQKEEDRKDPRTERRIRNKVGMSQQRAVRTLTNKDRPSMEIYRPGMGRLSMLQKKEKEKESSQKAAEGQESTSNSSSPSPTPSTTKGNQGDRGKEETRREERFDRLEKRETYVKRDYDDRRWKDDDRRWKDGRRREPWKDEGKMGRREGEDRRWKDGGRGGWKRDSEEKGYRRDYDDKWEYRGKVRDDRREDFRKEKSPKDEIEVRSMTFKRSVSREK